MAVAILAQAKPHWAAAACNKALGAILGILAQISARLPVFRAAALRRGAFGDPDHTAMSQVVELELSAISAYADFLQKNPGMPTDHRARFLARIMRSCEEVRKSLA